MKKSNKLIITALTVISAGIFYFLVEIEQSDKTVSGSQQVTKRETVIKQQQPLQEEKLVLVSEVLAEPMKYPKLAKRAKDIQKFQSLQQTTTSFYGKVEDQHGVPVAGATITGYRTYHPMIPNLDFSRSVEELSLTSDENGLFSIVDKKINSLAILKITKSGFEILANKTYVLSQGGYKLIQSFSDPAKPVIFHAWKKTEAEGLIYNEARINFDPVGRTYRIDLFHWVEGIKGEIRDVRMTCKRPLNIQRGYNPFDWAFSIEGINGGVIETDDIFMDEAPAVGYQPNWKFEARKDENNWTSEITRKFYLQSRGGDVYGRMELEIMPKYNNNCRVNAKWWLNPNGSRNLQYDPSKRIRPR